MSYAPSVAPMPMPMPMPTAGAMPPPLPQAPQPPQPEADVVDFLAARPDKCTDTLKAWLKGIVETLKEQTSMIHQRSLAALRVTERSDPIADPMANAESLDYVIHTREAADQRDAITAIESNLVVRNGKLCRIDAGDDETESAARVVNSALDYELDHASAKDETKKALRCFNTYPMGGLKSFREFEGGYTCFGIKSVNPHCYLISDAGRPCNRQFAMSELWFFTKREMRKKGFRNLDKLGQPDGKGDNKVQSDNTAPASSPLKGNETYRVYETWAAPPFFDWIMDEKPEFGSDVFTAWVNDWKLPPEYFASQSQIDGRLELNDSSNLLAIFHTENGEVLHVMPNYLVTPETFPHHCASAYAPTDDRFAGEGFIERSSDLYMMQHSLLNQWNQNMLMVGNQSMFVSDRAQVPEEEFKKIYKPRGIVKFSGNDAPEQLFHQWKPINIANDLLPGIQYAEKKIEDHGVNDTIRGTAQSRTATESNSNNLRGQAQVQEAGDIFISQCLYPALQDVKRMIVADYRKGDWLRTVGEDGAIMEKRVGLMTNVQEIDRHFRLYPVASFEYMNQSAIVSELTNVSSAFRGVLPPDMVQRTFKTVLECTHLTRQQIEYIEGNKGSYTDIMDEIQTMMADPTADIEVLPTDDHRAALAAVGMVVNGNPMTGEPPNPQFAQYPAVMRYVTAHQIALQAQIEEMMQMQAMQAQAGPQGRGKQVPQGGYPTTPEAQTRSQAQQVSPPDQTAQPGQTGMGAPPFAG